MNSFAAAIALCVASGGDDAADVRWVRALHLDLLRRPPLPEEWSASLGLSKGALLDHVVGSEGFWKAWFEDELYYFLLVDEFRPAIPSVLEIPDRLRERSVSVLEAIHRIVLSPSFNRRNPGADTFVTVVLEQCLGVTVQNQPALLAAGKRMYDGRKATVFAESGRGQADFVRIALSQDAFSETLLERAWVRLFGSEPARERIRASAQRLREEPLSFAPIVREWLADPLYEEAVRTARPRGELRLTRSLFVDLLGREPSEEEFRRARNAYRSLSDPRPLRAVFARLLLRSPEAKIPRPDPAAPEGWIRERFLRLLGRPPSSEELAAFRSTLAETGASPADIVEALVTHPEYASY
jgi:hypothetical protein